MSKSIEFYFDFGSPATYLAWTQLPALCAESGATLAYRPMLLGGVFQATGNVSPVTIPSKGKYMLQDLQRFAKRYRIPMKFNANFPINTLTLMRIATGVQMRQPEHFEHYLTTVFKAMWVDAVNMGDPAIVANVFNDAGFDAQKLLALAADPEVKDALKASTETAVKKGVFGAPSMFVGEVLFFGQDRLDFVREALLMRLSRNSAACKLIDCGPQTRWVVIMNSTRKLAVSCLARGSQPSARYLPCCKP